MSYRIKNQQRLEGLLPFTSQSSDQVVDIFARVNSDGVPLPKTDLLFSSIVAHWEQGRTEIESLITTLNNKGSRFNFDNDFVMRCFVPAPSAQRSPPSLAETLERLPNLLAMNANDGIMDAVAEAEIFADSFCDASLLFIQRISNRIGRLAQQVSTCNVEDGENLKSPSRTGGRARLNAPDSKFERRI